MSNFDWFLMAAAWIAWGFLQQRISNERDRVNEELARPRYELNRRDKS